eukprot:TCALIF_04781-PA protein Name:"Protein of unknown function" AED:0.42 eAED:0.52 QI:0/0/0/0.5/0/0/2/0/135
MASNFREVGAPHKLKIDGGSQFSSRKFCQFCESWQIAHETPRFHGKALRRSSTADQCFHLFFAHSKTFSSKWTDLVKTLDKPKLIQNRDKVQAHYNSSARTLRPLRIGDFVDIQNRNYANSRVLSLRLAVAEITT